MSLDELLRTVPEHRRHPDRAELTARVVLGILAVSATVALIAYQFLALAGLRVPYPLLVAVPAAGLFARRITARAHAEPAGPQGTHTDDSEAPAPGAAYQGIRRWASRLEGDAYGRDDFRHRGHPAMVALVDERLRLRHGVDRARDPARARVLMSEELWRFLNQPPRRRPRPAQVIRLVRQIEKL